MRILVCPHQMVMGGSQLTAIELAAAVRALGHEVILYAPRGPLGSKASDLALECITSPDGSHFSLAWIRGLSDVVRRKRIDLVHTYEWAPSMGLAVGPHIWRGTPGVMTVLSMDIPDFLPRHLALVVGTPSLAKSLSCRKRLYTIEPPIDLAVNRPRDQSGARSRWGIKSGEFLISVVGRLTTDLDKLGGVQAAIRSVSGLSAKVPVRLLIAGEGTGSDAVRSAADQANTRRGRDVVIVAGSLLDPADAYEAADVVLGMGSSALKGLAFAKPLIVQGAHGYFELFNEDSADDFLDHGFFGEGGGGAESLSKIVLGLVEHYDRLSELGAFGRRLVEERFSLDAAAVRLSRIYAEALAQPFSAGETYRSMVPSVWEFGKFLVAIRRNAAKAYLAAHVPVPRRVDDALFR